MCDHPNREAAMLTASEGAWCDPCLVPLVRALNDGGLPTVASCCGHGRRPSTVALADGRELLILRDYDEARSVEHLWPDINASTTATPDRAAQVRPSDRSPQEATDGSD